MKTSILIKLSLLSVPDKNRNSHFYESLGASKGDLFLIKLLKFLRIFLPLLLVVFLIIHFAFPDFSLAKAFASLVDSVRSLLGL